MNRLRIIGVLLCSGLAFGGARAAQADRFEGRNVIVTDARHTDQSAPLVVVLHGFTGTARNIQTKTGFDRLAAKHGFVAVYPQGRNRRWNDGRVAGNTVDDTGFLSRLITAQIVAGRADPTRIFLVGHSNGGGMAMRMACLRPDLVSAIVVNAAKAALGLPCQNVIPVAAMFLHGTSDPIMPHSGKVATAQRGGGLSSAATLAQWARHNGCARGQQITRYDRVVDGTEVRLARYKGCAAALMLVEINGHGHAWPNGTGRRGLLQGPATKEIDAAGVAWNFFRQF